MWKSFFLAVGIFLLFLGVETLVVDKFVMADGKAIPRLVSGSGAEWPFHAGWLHPDETRVFHQGLDAMEFARFRRHHGHVHPLSPQSASRWR